MYLEVLTKYIFNQIWDPQNVCMFVTKFESTTTCEVIKYT
jgi:hypothetical protein